MFIASRNPNESWRRWQRQAKELEMSSAATSFTPSEANTDADTRAATEQVGLMTKVVRSIQASRERAAAREIRRFIDHNGGVLTDSIEREISRRYGTLVN
jgi:hypothetical protein